MEFVYPHPPRNEREISYRSAIEQHLESRHNLSSLGNPLWELVRRPFHFFRTPKATAVFQNRDELATFVGEEFRDRLSPDALKVMADFEEFFDRKELVAVAQHLLKEKRCLQEFDLELLAEKIVDDALADGLIAFGSQLEKRPLHVAHANRERQVKRYFWLWAPVVLPIMFLIALQVFSVMAMFACLKTAWKWATGQPLDRSPEGSILIDF